MKSMKVLMVVAVMMVAGSAFAQTVTSDTNLDNITATVLAGCSITTFDIDFGNYDPSAADTTGTDTADVTCSTLHPYSVALSATSGSMAGPGTDVLNYDLALVAPAGGGTGTGSAQAYTINGTIPTGQYVQVGAYTDTVTIAVSF